MRVSIKICDELQSRNLLPFSNSPLQYSVRTSDNNVFGMVQLADDKEGFVIRPVLNGDIDRGWLPEKLSGQGGILPGTVPAWGTPPLVVIPESPPHEIILRIIFHPIRIICFHPTTGKELPHSEWYDQTEEEINKLLVEKPELKWAI